MPINRSAHNGGTAPGRGPIGAPPSAAWEMGGVRPLKHCRNGVLAARSPIRQKTKKPARAMELCIRAPACGRAAPAVGRPRAALAVRAAAYGAPQHNVTVSTGRREALLAGGALLGGLLLSGGAAAGPASAAPTPATDSIYDLSALMYGEEVPLERYRGKVSGRASGCRDEAVCGRCGASGCPWCRRPLHGKSMASCSASVVVSANMAWQSTRVFHWACCRCCWWSTSPVNDPCRCALPLLRCCCAAAGPPPPPTCAGWPFDHSSHPTCRT